VVPEVLITLFVNALSPNPDPSLLARWEQNRSVLSRLVPGTGPRRSAVGTADLHFDLITDQRSLDPAALPYAELRPGRRRTVGRQSSTSNPHGSSRCLRHASSLGDRSPRAGPV
jgi:hypothetical protein